MTIAGLSCALLLPAIGGLAYESGGAKPGDDKDSTDDLKGPTLDSEVELLRSLHGVTLLDPAFEGSGVDGLPNGVFGFTWSPAKGTPLFGAKKFQNFEVHKCDDGSVHLIGYVTEEDTTRLSTMNEEVEITLYPDVWENAFKAVSIAESRIAGWKGPSRSEGNALTLQVAPNAEVIQ